MNIDILSPRIRGEVITVLEPRLGAEVDALIWNGRKPARRARLIVRAACAGDVAEAVRFAAVNGLTISPRGGGHQFTGIATQADMVIDLCALDGLKLDAEARTARVEPAVTNARMAAALERHGLAFPLGHCGSVPMSGYLLGGGVGWNSAEWGFACFSVTAAEVVLADGRMVTATAEDHADVFWAARGAGPEFFGVVTAYHLALQPARKAISTTIRVYPGSSVVDVAAWAEIVMAKAPACVEFTAKVTPTPNGPMIASVATVFARTDAEACAVHAALGEGAPEALQVIGPMPTPFGALYAATEPSMPEGRRYAVDTVWSDARFGEVLGRVVEDMALAPSEASMALVVLRSNAVPTPGDAAFSCHGRVFGALYAIWQDEDEDAANLGWLRAAVDSVAPLCTGAYVGEADLDRPHRALRTLTPEAEARLTQLRALHDPSSLFHCQRRHEALAAE
ncbi:FAD-binding oxidoreductase [Silicimonas algicola]|uniref:FAD/FMN-containing dehydrogenase n=1 Tax=Silicimonas algicola TaxID=1826607 RepID=A0A316G174_9RHOB|nr:FAD-binding oxidoreductase [Silicimonas algicola]AZQ68368.1 FAD-binding oxidoreductase [Silicimonas algicola]PWK53550.1 FAD/FMN-containing dehydrogenase [Silicimonas algicola]